MHDPRTFETRLTTALGRYTADDPTVVDAVELARAIAADARSRRSAGFRTRLSLRSTPRFVSVLVTLVLLAALTGAALMVIGSQLLQPSPSPLIPAERRDFHPDGVDGGATRGTYCHAVARWPCAGGRWLRRRDPGGSLGPRDGHLSLLQARCPRNALVTQRHSFPMVGSW